MEALVRKEKMLRWVVACLIVCFSLVGGPGTASARKGDSSVELMPGYGFGPHDPDFEFDATFGAGIGFGHEVIDDVQLRIDVSYFEWDDSAADCDPFGLCQNLSVEFRHIPVFLGGRFFAPLSEEAIYLFADLGLSVNFLRAELNDLSTGASASESDTKLGLVPGLGIEFRLGRQIGVGANVRYHLLSKGVGDSDERGTSFLSAAALLAYRF